MEYITSDLHLYHKNICGPSGFVKTRQHYQDAVEMTEDLVAKHNQVVTNSDTVYILGDIALHGQRRQIVDTLLRLKGQLIIIKGNHDSRAKLLNYLDHCGLQLPDGRPKFITHDVGIIIKRNKKQYYLTHYPLALGEKRTTLRSLCGHIHEEFAPYSNCLNVGIDSPEINFGQPFGTPILLENAMAGVDNKWEKNWRTYD